MILKRQCLFFSLVIVCIIILFSGLTVIDVTSIPKPVSKYSGQIMDLLNFGLFYPIAPVKTSTISVFKYSTKYINDIAMNETTAASNGDASPSASDSQKMSSFIGLSSTRKPSPTSSILTTSNESQIVRGRNSNVHTEKTYMETFLDVPDIHFTDILRKKLLRQQKGMEVTNRSEAKNAEKSTEPPVDFLPNIKNPCWIEKVISSTPFSIKDGTFSGKLRCLPYFFVLGFPKCGTTDLHHRLSLHPDVKPPCAKEPHWWSRARFQGFKTLKSYLQCFDRAAVAISESLNYTAVTTRRLDKITMDCSASTAWDQSNWHLIPQNDRTSSEPSVTNIHAIHHLLPNSKFIVIMRNPVSRTFSDYLYFNKPSRVSPEHFHQSVNDSIAELETCFKTRSVRSCVYDKKFIYNKLQFTCRLYVSLYSLYIEEWLALFPRQQFLFLKTEDFGADLTQSITKVYKFLGLAVPNEAALQKIVNQPNANTRSGKKKAVGEMLPETRRLLEKFYSPWNKRLAKLLNDDRYLWF